METVPQNETPCQSLSFLIHLIFMSRPIKDNGRSSMPGTGEALRLARLMQRLTMAEVGRTIGSTSAGISYYERSDAVPDRVIAKLPAELRVPVAAASLRGHEAAMAALRKLLTK